MLIAISGRKQSGKDLVGKIIQYLTGESTVYPFDLNIDYSHKSNWEVKKFADKLKDIICILINCTREQLEDESFKNTELGEEWYLYIVKNTYSNEILSPCFLTKEEARHWEQTQDWYEDTGGYDTCVELIKPTPRFLLQFIGTNLFRNQLHPEIWVNSLMNEYKSKLSSNYPVDDLDWEPRFIYPNFIITDTRFENELEAVKKREGITIRVNRPDLEQNNHPSETSLDSATFDFIINNDKDIEHLINEVREILKKENLI